MLNCPERAIGVRLLRFVKLYHILSRTFGPSSDPHPLEADFVKR